MLDFDAAEDVALTQLLKEEGCRYSGLQRLLRSHEQGSGRTWRKRKSVNKSWLTTRFPRLFAHFGFEKDGTFICPALPILPRSAGQTISGAHELLDSLIGA